MKNKVIYYYSACVGIIVGSLKILCDPWFTDGAYYGSWYQYPKFENPIDNIPEYEYSVVSLSVVLGLSPYNQLTVVTSVLATLPAYANSVVSLFVVLGASP